MEAANKAAKATGILSAARMVFMSEAHPNPYVEARMPDQMSEMIHRQADFHLDFPIFV
ncbi:hypothetical protein [Candidatus Protochlamydia phocaeensis]|uniref:hypothetical protein n=1 Tax=Candidatus Protochlamydia phocaeensis TaxID=1414722 RepID=UPI000AA16FBA|nr:hypothetical protein [Candidatus Protochlamydia phocaeensis]